MPSSTFSRSIQGDVLLTVKTDRHYFAWGFPNASQNQNHAARPWCSLIQFACLTPVLAGGPLLDDNPPSACQRVFQCRVETTSKCQSAHPKSESLCRVHFKLSSSIVPLECSFHFIDALLHLSGNFVD